MAPARKGDEPLEYGALDADFYEEVAEDMGVPIDDDILPDLLGDNRYKSDHVHPNAAAHARVRRRPRADLR